MKKWIARIIVGSALFALGWLAGALLMAGEEPDILVFSCEI